LNSCFEGVNTLILTFGHVLLRLLHLFLIRSTGEAPTKHGNWIVATTLLQRRQYSRERSKTVAEKHLPLLRRYTICILLLIWKRVEADRRLNILRLSNAE
jgi:hypothetical protein